ncbi:hypothetical protein BDY24DRAFT_394922 [Mrakia frigida]|uniref:uncharacterized protein n=1 Tax=Mrakia frigida TaxID=29902 RepID=UPI003FCBF8F5
MAPLTLLFNLLSFPGIITSSPSISQSTSPPPLLPLSSLSTRLSLSSSRKSTGSRSCSDRQGRLLVLGRRELGRFGERC